VFPIALTPGHEKRRSRYATNLIIAMQPKWVIDNLMSTPEKREHATGMVRGLLKKYDDVEISPDLSNIGETGTTESRQLTLLDHNESSECPYEDMDI
jgi:FPC/CPF motif-containing protein YcgG